MDKQDSNFQPNFPINADTIKYYQTAIDDLPAMVDLFLPDGTIIFANKLYRDFFGIDIENFGTSTIFDHMQIQDQKEIRQKIESLSASNPLQTNENLVIGRDQKRHWVRWTNKALFDEQGSIFAYQSLGIDITSEKRVESKNNDILLDLNKAQRIAHIGSWVWDPDSDGSKWSDELFEITGRNPADGIPEYQEYIDQCHPDDKERMEMLIENAKAGEIFQDDFRIFRHNDHRERTLRLIGEVVVDENGKGVRHIGTVQDITDQVKIREQFQLSEERYQSAVEYSPIMIDRFLPDGTITFSNQACNEFFSGPGSSLVGRNLFSFVPEEIRSNVKKTLSSLTPESPSRTVEHTVVRYDGEIRWVIWTDRAFFDETGKITELQSYGLDTTERKQAENALAESERVLSTLLGNLPGIAYRAAAKKPYHLEYISQGCKELTGYQPSELVHNSKLNIEIIHPHDRDRLTECIENAIKNRSAFEITYRIKTASGEEKCVLEKGQTVANAAGEITHTEGLIMDISTRVRMEQELRNSEKRYQSVVNDSPILIARFNPDGTITFANKECTEYFHGKNSSVLGDKIFDYVESSEKSRLEAYFRNFTPSDVLQSGEMLVVRHDGQSRWMRWLDRAFFDEDGNIAFFQSYGIDIHDEKITQIKLAESESRFRAFMENFPANAYIKDENLRHIFVNKAASDFAGISVDEYIGKKTSEIYPQELAHSLEESDRTVLEKQKTIEREGYYTTASGNRRFQHDIKFPLQGPNGENLVGGIALDLTMQKKAEISLIEQAQFEKLLSNISSSFLDSTPGEFDEKVCEALRKAGKFFNIAQIKVLYVANDEQALVALHEWTDKKKLDPDWKQNFNNYPFLINSFKKGEVLIWPNPSKSPPDIPVKTEKKLFKEGVQSLAAVPVQFSDLREGGIVYICTSNSDIFTGDIVEKLRLFSQIISNAISLNTAQLTLRDSEARYRSVVEDSPILISRFLPDGTITFVNAAYAKYKGMSINELIGKNVFDFQLEDELPEMSKRINSLSLYDPLYTVEKKERRYDGKIYWVRWNVRGLFDDNEKLSMIQTFGFDITDQRDLQDAIIMERDKAQRYLELVQTIVIALNKKGEIILVNSKACEVLGFEENELLGKKWIETCIPARFRSEIMHVFRNAMASNLNTFENHVNPIMTKSGEERIISWHNIALSDNNGKIIGFLSSGEDITELKNAEDRMRALLDISSRVSNESFENNPLQTIVSEILNKVTSADAVTIMLLNEKKDKFVAKASSGYQSNSIHDLSIGVDQGILGMVFRSKKTIIRNDIPNDKIAIINILPEMNTMKSLIYAPLIYQNKFFGVLCIDNFHHINAFQESDIFFIESVANQLSGVIENIALFKEVQKNREELRALSSRLVSLHENERKMIAMDLHDHFGQILTALKLSLRAESFIRKNEKDQRMQLAEISTIVDELLDAAEDLSLRLRPTILDDLGIERAFEWHIQRYARQIGIPINTDIHLTKGVRFPDQIELTLYRAMEESLANAVRHGSPSKIDINISEDKDYLYMTIYDNGAGFDTSSQQQISYMHTGITGLRERINVLSGKYGITSRVGKGTTIEITLPKKLPENKNND